MTQKKFLQLAGIAVATVWVFCITFVIAYTIKSKSPQAIPVDKQTPITTGVVNTTAAPSTTLPALSTTIADIFTAPPTSVTNSAASTPNGLTTDTPTTEQPTTEKSKVPKEKADIINAYINGVNQLKNTQNFSMQKNDTLNVRITDVQMSGGNALKNAVMEFANGLTSPPPPESYTFIGGYDAATGKTPNSTVAPLNKTAQVNYDAVTDASAAATADGGYTINLTLQPETQTMHAAAPNLSTMVQVIDPSILLPDGATLTELSINYQPSTIKATFDSQDRIVSMEHRLISQGGGSGKMIISVKMTMEGTYTSNYTITYN